MRKLEIQISKAVLKSYSVNFKNDEISVDATIGLLTEGGKQITTYRIDTNSWRDEDKFDLPLSAYEPIKKIALLLEQVVTEHCNANMLALPDPEKNEDN